MTETRIENGKPVTETRYVDENYQFVPRQDPDGNRYYEPRRPGTNFPQLPSGPFVTPNGLRLAPGQIYPNGFQPDEMEIAKLVQSYRASDDDAKREEIREQLVAATKQVFEQRLAERKQRLDEARAELDRISKTLSERESMAEKIIERRVADLVNDPDPLSWDFRGEDFRGEQPYPSSGFGSPFDGPAVVNPPHASGGMF